MAVTCSCFQSRGTSPGCRDFSDTDEWQGDYVRQFPQDSARSHLRTSISRGRRGAAFLQSGSLPPDPATAMKSPHSAPSVGPAPPQPPGNASRRPRSVPPPARGARGFSREGSAPRRRAPPGAIPPGPRSPGRDGGRGAGVDESAAGYVTLPFSRLLHRAPCNTEGGGRQRAAPPQVTRYFCYYKLLPNNIKSSYRNIKCLYVFILAKRSVFVGKQGSFRIQPSVELFNALQGMYLSSS
ncbi:uncharacterized protein LOC124417516 [Gallus gallus]|uniref:uncharacterized protein LOC124417516 n=1 Tax=Gallus gallus TaxID=9031 RepID=UPI001F01C208|nr:uncharacterized protein LOC124417516 [Gallus gallus]XP_046791509.1 uncharacterized protein LOC124417516 [Gallus gallus]